MTPEFFLICNDLATQLSGHIKGEEAGRLLLTTIVNLDDFNAPSALGRTLTETLSTSLFLHGYNVVEVRKAGDLMIKKDGGGELILTRDIDLMASQYQGSAILAGTYSITPSTVIVNLRLLRVDTHDVLSVAGVEIPRSEAIDHLLAARGINSEPILSGYERQGG